MKKVAIIALVLLAGLMVWAILNMEMSTSHDVNGQNEFTKINIIAEDGSVQHVTIEEGAFSYGLDGKTIAFGGNIYPLADQTASPQLSPANDHATGMTIDPL